MKHSGHKSASYKIILLAVLIISVQHSYALFKNDSNSVVSYKINAKVKANSVLQDTVPQTQNSDFINASIAYDWSDSTLFDAANQIMYLYGNAHVNYDGMELSAAYIEYDFKSNIATAKGMPDSTGVIVGKPIFSNDGQVVTQDSLRFNLATKTGISSKVVTSDGDAYILSETSKIHKNNWVHIRNGKFTTCDAENPHYHFHLSKAIAVPNERVVTGPVYLKFRKIPTPLALPFGFFPNKQESSHGIIIPGYGNGNELGFFIQKLGYYIPINESWDTKVLFDIYTRGSWTVQNQTNYKKRYKYSGSFNVTNSVFKRGLVELPSYSEDRTFFVDWIHRQDSKAKPNTSFSADVKFGSTNNFTNNISASQADFLQGTFNSSINWSKTFTGIPSTFTVQAREVQNAITRNFRITLPSLSLSSSNSFAVFVPRGRRIPSKFYNKLKYTYNTYFDNILDATESELALSNFDELLRKTQKGFKHNLTVTTNTKIFSNLVSVTPRFNWNEFWTFDTYEESFSLDEVVGDTVSGFQRTGDWNAGFSMTTKFFGMFRFKRSKNISAIRHVMTPSLSFSYAPENLRRVVYGQDDLQQDLTYNPWQLAAFRANDVNERGTVSLNLQNNLEMKVRDKSVTKPTWKKVRILDNLNISSGYNFMADSLHLNPVSTNFSTSIAKKFKLYGGAAFDAYDRDTIGRRVDAYLAGSQGQLLRMTSANLTVGWNLKSKNKKGTKNETNASDEELDFVARNEDKFVDFTVPWTLNLSYSTNIFRNFDIESQSDTSAIASGLLFSGDFRIMEKWMVSFNSGYDLVNRDFTTTSINLYWDLHCWELAAEWVPIGVRKSYMVRINIKSSLLKDLKLQRIRPYGDTEFF